MYCILYAKLYVSAVWLTAAKRLHSCYPSYNGSSVSGVRVRICWAAFKMILPGAWTRILKPWLSAYHDGNQRPRIDCQWQPGNHYSWALSHCGAVKIQQTSFSLWDTHTHTLKTSLYTVNSALAPKSPHLLQMPQITLAYNNSKAHSTFPPLTVWF